MIKLHLPFYGIELITDEDSSDVPMKKTIVVHHKGLKLRMFEFRIDERDNTIDIHPNTEISKILESKFKDFKRTNINYGSIGSGNDYEYDGTETLYLKDFLE